MPVKMTLNKTPDPAADWGAFSIRSNCPPPLAQRMAMRDPEIRAFVVCRAACTLKGKNLRPGDAVFIKTTPTLQDNKACDTYEKDFFNVAYLDSRIVPLRYAGALRLKQDRRPFFDIVCLFAAVMHGGQDDVHVALGDYVGRTLDNTDDVRALQSLGITVLLTVLPDHGPAGWSNFTSEKGASAFADKLLAVARQYGLDGIDIDDEYSKPPSPVDPNSLIMVARRLRQQGGDLILSKALFEDESVFQRKWKEQTLAQQLTYGWEMSYPSTSGLARLTPYTEEPPEAGMRMKPHQLGLGVLNSDRNSTPPDKVEPQTRAIKNNDYGGMMVDAVEDFVRAPPFETIISNVFYGQDVKTMLPGCWSLPTGALALAHTNPSTNGVYPLHVSLAAAGQGFGAPIAVRTAGQETTDVGSAMAVFQKRLWVAWTGPMSGANNKLNVCSGRVDMFTQQIEFSGKRTFDDYRSKFSPALAAFKDKLYLAWVGGLNNSLAVKVYDNGDWGPIKPIPSSVLPITSAPSWAIVGDRLHFAAVAAGKAFAWSSADGNTFSQIELSLGSQPEEVQLANYGDWLYVAFIARTGDTKQISVGRTQDYKTFEFWRLPELSQSYSGLRLATWGPDMYVVARDRDNQLQMWTSVEGAIGFQPRQLLSTVASVAMPGLLGITDLFADGESLTTLL
jgi:hypothetical protein